MVGRARQCLATYWDSQNNQSIYRLQVNCLSTPLVALLLLPHMLRTAQEYSTVPRLVVVASEVHYWASIPKSVLESGKILATIGSEEYCTPK